MSDTSVKELIKQAAIKVLASDKLTADDLATITALEEAGYLKGDTK